MQQYKQAFEEEKSNKAKLQKDMDKLRAFYDEKMKSVEGQLAGLPTTAESEREFFFLLFDILSLLDTLQASQNLGLMYYVPQHSPILKVFVHSESPL